MKEGAIRLLGDSQLLAVCFLALSVALVLYRRGPTPLMVMGLPYAPFEPVVAPWLTVNG